MDLALCELRVILSSVRVKAEIRTEKCAGLDMIVFAADALDERALAAVSVHSSLYLLVRIEQDGALLPVCSRRDAYLSGDLPSILKYKGKTNEMFTQFLINMAVFSSAFADKERGQLSLLDPMCGKGTTLFQAVNRGWNAAGCDIARAEIAEANSFFKKYLEFHRIKHTTVTRSQTLRSAGSVSVHAFEYAAASGAFKAGDTRTLKISCANAQGVDQVFGKRAFEVLCTDLPYGIQHAPGGFVSFDYLLQSVLPAWKEALKPGGALAVSFNANTLKTETVKDRLTAAGFAVCDAPEYQHLSHWVEQAVTRDVVIALRK